MLVCGLGAFHVFAIVLPLQLVLLFFLYFFVFQNKTHYAEMQPMASLISPASNDVIIAKKQLLETVAVKTGNKLYIIPVSEIVCFQSYGDYVNIMTLHGTYLKEKTLKYFEEHLPDEQFVRVHRSYIVNLRAINVIERSGRDQYSLLLSNKEKIKATLEGYKKLQMALNL
jgi:DNA-binding LytR/AlgR family response regulator